MNPLTLVANPKIRGELARALNLITDVQLNLFRDTPAPTREDILSQFSLRMQQRGVVAIDDTEIVDIARELLGSTLDTFNDPFANYVTPESLKKYKQRRNGQFVGIGVKFRARKESYPVVIGPLTGGPLEHANIKPGDQIRAIDGVDLFASSSEDIGEKLRGKEGSSVRLQLARTKPDQIITLDAVRQKVKLSYLRVEVLDGNVGYIKISRFAAKTHLMVEKYLRQLLLAGVVGIILDLRDNPGGSTLAARATVSLFQEDRHVYAEQYKSGAVRLLPRIGNKVTDLPVAVLANEKSMSSAEIVAGALQVSARAKIVGAPTYGKGLIQRVFDLKPPLGGAIRATIAVYATLDETLIHGVGIVPDIYVASAKGDFFVETGSLNISAAAQTYRRQLLHENIYQRYDADEAAALIQQTDEQLERAVMYLRNL